jgi:hypothetical protein
VKIATFYRWFAAAYFLLGSLALAQPSLEALHGHVRPAVLSGKAAPAGLMARDARLNLSIVLPLRNQAELAATVSRLYDPASSDYHHFLTQDQFTQQFAPTVDDYNAVVRFAQASGFTVAPAPANRLLVPISGTVAQVENAFHVKMGLYQHPTENRLFFSPDREPTLQLNVPVQHIAGLDNYSRPRPMVTRANAAQATPESNSDAAGSGPGGSYLASDIRAAYYGGAALDGSGQTIALLEFDGYNASDVSLTLSNAGQSSAVPVNNVLLDGTTGLPTSGDDSEEVLDIVQAVGMAPGLSQVRVYIGGSDVDLLNAIASEDIAKQVSISWSWSPADPSTDDEFFEELAAQGQSVFAASGDWGEFDPYFNNFFPAEDAYVTAVGGTVLTTSGAGQSWSSETAWNRSGGGASPDGVRLPAWQAGVSNSSNGGSATLRNVPDVAAEANNDNYLCSMGICLGDYGGTSFAAPRWAGFMALVNQQAEQNNDPAIGFLNPALYALGAGSSYADSFHDIVIGNNDARDNCCGWPYYYAVPGYDLVTGWGSPAGQSLIDALAPQGAPSFTLSSSVSSLSIDPGSSGTATIHIADASGFSGRVHLSVSGLPHGVKASWSRDEAEHESVLTLNAESWAGRHSYLLTVTGTSGSQSQTTSLELTVNAPGFTLLPSPSSVKIYPGTSGTVSFFVTGLGGFDGSVNLAITSGLPSGITATWVENPSASSSTLTLTASDSAQTNIDAQLTITGTSGNVTATTTLSLVVTPPLFYLNIAPYPLTIAQGGTIVTSVSAVPVDHFSDTIKLSAPALPPGVTATFNPSSISFGETSTLTLTASSAAPVANGVAAIEAGGSYSETLNQFNLNVTAAAAPAFTLGVAHSSLKLAQGSSIADGISITPMNGFTGNVNLSVTSGLPGGVTASFSPSTTAHSSQLTLSASNTSLAGFYTLWITGTSGTQSTVATVFVTVNPPPGFTLSATPGNVNLVQGASTANNVTVVPQAGFTGVVNLQVTSPLPDGVTAAFAPSQTSSGSVLTLSADYSARAGDYPVTVSGTSNGRTVTTTIPLNVQAVAEMPTAITLALSSGANTLTSGQSFTLTATVTPAGGAAPPTGNVLFTIGNQTQAAALDATGVATLSAVAPADPGSVTISATYQGAAGFASSASAPVNASIASPIPASFALAGTSLSIAPGSNTGNTVTITLSSSGGFSGAVDLTAKILSSPAGATHLPVLSFNGTTPVMLSNGTASAVLTVSTTDGSTTTASSTPGGLSWYPGATALACIVLLGVPRRRNWQALLGIFALFLVLTNGMVACGGSLATISTTGTTANATTSGAYTIAVTGTSGATAATTTVTLTVK